MGMLFTLLIRVLDTYTKQTRPSYRKKQKFNNFIFGWFLKIAHKKWWSAIGITRDCEILKVCLVRSHKKLASFVEIPEEKQLLNCVIILFVFCDHVKLVTLLQFSLLTIPVYSLSCMAHACLAMLSLSKFLRKNIFIFKATSLTVLF